MTTRFAVMDTFHIHHWSAWSPAFYQSPTWHRRRKCRECGNEQVIGGSVPPMVPFATTAAAVAAAGVPAGEAA